MKYPEEKVKFNARSTADGFSCLDWGVAVMNFMATKENQPVLDLEDFTKTPDMTDKN